MWKRKNYLKCDTIFIVCNFSNFLHVCSRFCSASILHYHLSCTFEIAFETRYTTSIVHAALLLEHIRRYPFIHFPNYNPIIASCLPPIFYSSLPHSILLVLAHFAIHKIAVATLKSSMKPRVCASTQFSAFKTKVRFECEHAIKFCRLHEKNWHFTMKIL